MTPSEVVAKRIANQHCPLTDTLGRSEREVAAAILVIALAESGDTWGPISPRTTAITLKSVFERPEYSFLKNPFLRPDYADLVTKGFARWTMPDDGPKSPIEFTEIGIHAIQRAALPKEARWDASIASYRLDPPHLLQYEPGVVRSTTGVADNREQALAWGYTIIEEEPTAP